MINLSTILTEIKKYIGLQYVSNEVIKLIGTNDRLINYTHPLLTPQAISALTELTLPNYKGDWESAEYETSNIVKYNDKYYIASTGILEEDENPEINSNWTLYDALTTNITKEFDNQVKVILSEIYSDIKNNGQTQDVLHSGKIFAKGSFNLSDSTHIIRLIPKTGILKINTINLKSKNITNVSLDIYDLEDYENVYSDTEIVNTSETVTINKESAAGFVIRIEPDNDLFIWEFWKATENLKIDTRTDTDLTDVEQYKDEYFTGITKFACEIDAKIYCDLTDFFVNNIEILIPYLNAKLAHYYTKCFLFNGAARSNKFEANDKTRNAEMDIYGDKMNVGSLVKEIEDMRKNLISKFGYGNPCLKMKKGKISYESI